MNKYTIAAMVILAIVVILNLRIPVVPTIEEFMSLPHNSWGYGQHIFEPIAKGSPQYEWLKQELQSEAYQQAKYKIAMLHHPPHTLGGNIVPPFTDPQPKLTYTEDGRLQSRYYDYPIENDYIIRDLLPDRKSVV